MKNAYIGTGTIRQSRRATEESVTQQQVLVVANEMKALSAVHSFDAWFPQWSEASHNFKQVGFSSEDCFRFMEQDQRME